MQILADTHSLREQLSQLRSGGKKVALVPTMGNLHEGHLTLVREAKKRADIVVVSIFVNPMQFERADDLNNYPRTLEQDTNRLEQEGVDIVFTPTPKIMYPAGLDKQTFVEVPGLSQMLEGASRPGHFRGVATIVAKLFNIVQPDVACFGEKDYQQLAMIRQMVNDLCMNIEIHGVATVREPDGLAMSSRNGLLTTTERQQAPAVAETMYWIAQQISNSACDSSTLIQQASERLLSAGLKPDEIFIRDAKTLQPLNDNSTQAVILMSAFLGKARLIDNKVAILHTPQLNP